VAEREHPDDDEQGEPEELEPGPRALWSGTLTFGLVSIPVELYPAVRPARVALRLLGPRGRPLHRRYVCARESRPLTPEEIVRGYPVEPERFVLVEEEELAALAPRASRDLDLRRFVPRDQLDPMLLDRPYLLAPGGQSTKAYHLLAATLERRDRAGIATFVMRGTEYLAAILSEGGLLRAVTLRFADELRGPEQLGLPEPRRAPAARRRQLEAALAELERDALLPELLHDENARALRELARRKRAASADVIELPETAEAGGGGGGQVVDLMKLLQERLGEAPAPAPRAASRRSSGGARAGSPTRARAGARGGAATTRKPAARTQPRSKARRRRG